MSADKQTKRGVAFRVMMVAAMILMGVAYASPIWWVSLSAPQYPESMFPDGIRIHFHFDGVYNGCSTSERAEIASDEALDCKHEMDAINHYVGMYPIAAGAPIERALSPFMVSLLGVMMLAFVMPGRKSQLAVLAVGGAGVVAWMSAAMFTAGGIHLISPQYVADMEKTMALWPEDYADWTALQAIQESYREALGRYFREADKITAMVGTMTTATYVIYGLVVAAAALLVGGMLILPRLVYWVLGLAPAVLPVAFVVDYSAWLYWFGHNLNEMGAFTLKPFMPTVFGQGKVAQFTTYSYPHYGFGLLLAVAVLAVLAVLIRRKQLQAAPGGDEAPAAGAQPVSA